MLAKGPMPGFSPKSEALALEPGATCIRLSHGSLRWYEVSNDTRIIGRGSNSIKAWEDALDWLLENKEK